MLILALDCSTARGSAALAVGSGLEDFRSAGARNFPPDAATAGELFTTLERGLAEMRRDGEQLGEIVVGLGPGSYSGVTAGHRGGDGSRARHRGAVARPVFHGRAAIRHQPQRFKPWATRGAARIITRG